MLGREDGLAALCEHEDQTMESADWTPSRRVSDHAHGNLIHHQAYTLQEQETPKWPKGSLSHCDGNLTINCLSEDVSSLLYP